jgi:hypothetical protein
MADTTQTSSAIGGGHKLIARDFIPVVGFFKYVNRTDDNSNKRFIDEIKDAGRIIALMGYHQTAALLGLTAVAYVNHGLHKLVEAFN